MKMMRRLVLVALVVCGLMTQLSVGAANAETNPESVYQTQVLALINETRAQLGVRPLIPDAVLAVGAQKWAVYLASIERLEHKKDLGRGMGKNWTKLGENLGRGDSIESVYTAWLASPRHLENIVDPAYDSFGFGIVERGGDLWMVQRFRQTR